MSRRSRSWLTAWVFVPPAALIVQFAAIVARWVLEHYRRPGDEATAFWGQVLKRYWTVGAVVYCVFSGRQA